MDIDPKDIVETAKAATEQTEARAARLNAAVAITVAVLATFMGICKVKDDNIVQAMQQAQADKVDHWSYYQARNVRQEVGPVVDLVGLGLLHGLHDVVVLDLAD